MTTCIALIRGINVGRAKRLPMAELRGLIENLGNVNVRTLLNSGNVVFDSQRPNVIKLAHSIGAAIEGKFGFSAPVIALTAADFNTIVQENPLHTAEHDPSRFLVVFVASLATLVKTRPLLAESWSPEAVAVGRHAAYLWCANGINESKLLQAFGRLAGEASTTRNWATVLKLQAVAGIGKNIA